MFVRKRLWMLCGALLGLTALVPISRHYLLSKPLPPPASATPAARMRYYARRIETDPSDVEAYVKLGALNEASEFYTEALKHLCIARALGAKDADIILPIGRALTHLARFEEALPELNHAVDILPDSLEAAADLAGLYDAYGQPNMAARTLRRYVEHHPQLTTGNSSALLPDINRLMTCFIDAGDDDMALKMAEQFSRLAPNQPDGYSLAGKILLTRHEAKAALPQLEKAIALAPDAAALAYQYGMALKQVGREDDALTQWQKTIQLNSSATDAYYRLAETYGRRKDYKRAAPIFRRIALRDPNNALLAHAAGLAFEKTGEKTEAAYWKCLEAFLVKDFAASLAEARKVAADPAWRIRGLARVAEAYRGMNRAEDYLNTVRQMTAGHTAEEDEALANAYGLVDRLPEEKQWLETALTQNPKDPANIHLLLAGIAQQKGLRDEAEFHLQQASRLDPKNTAYHRELGNLYMDRRTMGGRLLKAIHEYEQYTLLAPTDATGFQKLGIAYAAAENWHRAAQSLEHSLDLQPGQGATYQELGRVYAKLGDKAGSEQMLQLYRKYVAYDLQRQTLVTKSRADRKDPTAQAALAAFLERAGDYPSAARYYRLAASLRPTDSKLQAKVRQMDTMLGQTIN